MLLTTCAVCSTPLSDGVVQCADCATRYCGERCERMDRRRNGHGKVCGVIARGGGAEQYHADKKYAEAATEAIEACAEETAGKTCYICLKRVWPRSPAYTRDVEKSRVSPRGVT